MLNIRYRAFMDDTEVKRKAESAGHLIVFVPDCREHHGKNKNIPSLKFLPSPRHPQQSGQAWEKEVREL
jgi:GT2 family glycosyltransferase